MNICERPVKNPLLHSVILTNLQSLLRILGHRLGPQLIGGESLVSGRWLLILSGGLHSQPAPRSTCPIADPRFPHSGAKTPSPLPH